MPWPVILSLVGVFIGLSATALWGPGSSKFSLHTASIICLVGGFSVWIWILQTVLIEDKSIRPFEPRPQASNRSSDTEIGEWFRRTIADCNDRRWVLTRFLFYIVGLLCILALADIEGLKDYVDVIYIFSIMFYGYVGVVSPTRYMVDY